MFAGKRGRGQVSRPLISIFTPATIDSGASAATPGAPSEGPMRPAWEWAIFLLVAGAGAAWSASAGSSERTVPFCVGAALGLALAIVARGNWSVGALLFLGGAGVFWPENARVAWTLGGALGLVLAHRAPVALILAGASALAVFWIRAAREQSLPWPVLGVLLVTGVLVGALIQRTRPKNHSEFEPLGALAIIGGALMAETLAQGAGVAAFAGGGALWGVLVGATRARDFSDGSREASNNEASDLTSARANLWGMAAMVALWRVLEAQVPALRFGADAGDLTVLWGALLTAALLHYDTRVLAPLVCAVAPLLFWFGWGPKVVPGLWLGAALVPLLGPRALHRAAVFACALVGLAPFVETLPPQTRAAKLVAGAALVALWLLFDALAKWLARERKL